ncbi:MAG: precorrin-2 dehydrogenase/sirohydrochlorin ferrochelatase family protein, partial [Vicinamibacterales bacterium]
MSELLPLFLNLTGRVVVLVGGGPVATAKLRQLLAVGACVRIVATEITDEIARLVAAATPPPDISLAQRRFEPFDLDGAWLAIAAATPDVNRQVADAAEMRRIFVNAVDDPANATAFLSGVVRRHGVTLAISTSGAAPALTALLREGLDALLPRDLANWMWQARAARVAWRREGVPMVARKPRLLQALNALYPDNALSPSGDHRQRDGREHPKPSVIGIAAVDRPRVPW